MIPYRLSAEPHMEILFYLHATVAVLAMGFAMLTPQAIHALIATVFSLLNLAISLYLLSAPLAAALLAIVYAGAIMVLFVFVVMLMGVETTHAKYTFKSSRFIAALGLSVLFFINVVVVLKDAKTVTTNPDFTMQEIATALIKDNSFLLEMASMVLLAGLITAIFIGARFLKKRQPVTANR